MLRSSGIATRSRRAAMTRGEERAGERARHAAQVAHAPRRASGKQIGARATHAFDRLPPLDGQGESDGAAEGMADDERAHDAECRPPSRDHRRLGVGRAFVLRRLRAGTVARSIEGDHIVALGEFRH